MYFPSVCGRNDDRQTASRFSGDVRETAAKRVGMFPPDDVRIEPSDLGERAGVWGGIALARDPAVTGQAGTE